MIEIVFFDAGETLLSPKPSFPELAGRVIRGRGHDVGDEDMLGAFREVSHRFRRTAESGRTFSTSAEESKAFWLALYGEVFERLGLSDEEGPLRLYETFSDPANYGLFPETRPTLEAIALRGKRMGVISNFERWLEGLLEQLGVRPLFDVMAISGIVGWEKPDPRIFEWATREAGVEPGSCVHVGDQPYFDPEPAIALGMRGVLLDRHGRFAELDVDYPLIRRLDELPSLIERMETPG